MLDPTPDPVNPSAGQRHPTRIGPMDLVQNNQRTPSDHPSATPKSLLVPDFTPTRQTTDSTL
jgi:hypothetical protein